jgi:peptidyl serine alpha-galactosyltransferase
MICYFSEQGHERNGRGTLHAAPPEGPRNKRFSVNGIHTVFSVSSSLYQRWQADLLAYSHEKVGQPGPLTRLLCSHEQPTPFACRTFRTAPYSPHPVSGDDYTAYNKPAALNAWLQEEPPSEDVLLILNPDCIFLEPLAGSVSRGSPVVQPWDLLHPTQHRWFVEKHCSNPELVGDVGVPILIHKDDLVALAPLWLEKTEQIRSDPVSRQYVGWIAEMWGYTTAAAELGLRHTKRGMQRLQTEDRTDLPIVHYCYSSSDAKKRWTWSKRTYRPWERVPVPPDESSRASKVLIELLNEWVAMQKHQICLFET